MAIRLTPASFKFEDSIISKGKHMISRAILDKKKD